MRKFLPLLLVAAIGLAGCGTRLNPFNWFGSSQSRPAPQQEATETTNPLIPRRSVFARDDDEDVDLRQPVARLENMVIERTPGGAIIRVTGIAANSGPFDVALRPVGDGPVDGVMRYVMVSNLREDAQMGPIQTRRVTAAVRLSNTQLREISLIEVAGVDNILSSRR